MAHIREMVIESNKTLEESGSYRKAGRSMTVTFRPDEYPLTKPEEDGNWDSVIMALGKKLDHQVDTALGLATAKAPDSSEKKEQLPDKPKPSEKKDWQSEPISESQLQRINMIVQFPQGMNLMNGWLKDESGRVEADSLAVDDLDRGQGSRLYQFLKSKKDDYEAQKKEAKK